MNRMNRYTYQRILVLFLTVCFLSGCTGGKIFSGNTPAETTSSQDYEIYQKEALLEQKEFEAFSRQLFQERVTSSSLGLHYSLADPDAYGITDYPITYGDFSVQFMRDEIQKLKDQKMVLDRMDADLLTDGQTLTYRILAESYETELTSEGMELYYQPLGPMIGLQAQLPILLSEYQFYNKQDVDNYLALLSQTDEYFTKILAFQKEKAAAGLFMTDEILEEVLSSCEGYLLAPERSFLSETFVERLSAVEGLTPEEITEYTAQNLSILGEDFVSAYQLLTEGLTQLKGSNTNDKGMCYYPRGKEYYEYLIRSNTGTTYETIDQLKDAIETQMDMDLISMSKIIKEAPDALTQLTDLNPSQSDPSQILNDLIQDLDTDFPKLPDASYTIKYVPAALETTLSPAFYLTPPMDRYQENTIYINRAQSSGSDLFPTLAHEGYPGHLYQTVYFLNKCKEDLRQVLSFTSYNEGWAFYVENYSYTLNRNLDPDVAQLLAHNSSSSLGLHAVLDLYINYYGWTKEQVADYLKQYYELEETDIVDTLYTAMIANPTNYLEYYVGYLEILQMRNIAEKTLKNKFNLKEFHTFLLDLGPAPFTVIEPYFKTWLLTYDL